MSKTRPAIIVTGDIDKGFVFIGPFSSKDEARKSAETDPHLEEYWVVAELEPSWEEERDEKIIPDNQPSSF